MGSTDRILNGITRGAAWCASLTQQVRCLQISDFRGMFRICGLMFAAMESCLEICIKLLTFKIVDTMQLEAT